MATRFNSVAQQSLAAVSSNRDDAKENNNPHLERLLKQLRPFQREAYDYATKGIVSSRQFHVPKHVESKKYKRRNKSDKDAEQKTNKTADKKMDEKPVKLNGRLLLADEMGLGKSITSLAIMCHYYDEWPLLILCPASLRHIWPNEIEKFIPGLPASSVYVVQGFDDADFYENETKRKHIKVVVATYSILQTRSASARCLQEFKFKCIIADESHNLKQKNSQRTQLAMPLLHGAKRLALLSGTVRRMTDDLQCEYHSLIVRNANLSFLSRLFIFSHSCLFIFIPSTKACACKACRIMDSTAFNRSSSFWNVYTVYQTILQCT